LPTRRSFLSSGLSSLGWLAAGGAGAWYLRDRVFWPTPDAASLGGPDSSGWLPFAAPRQRLVTIGVTVNGEPVTALLDSGAQYSVVDRAWAEKRGLQSALAPPMVAYGAGGGAQLGRGASVHLTVGALTLSDLKVAILELGPIVRASGVAMPLILGQDLLSVLVADIDFPGRRVALRRPETVEIPNDGVVAPARREGRALHVEVALEGTPLDVLVDTGASGALALTAPTAETLGLSGRPARTDSSIVLGGVAQARVITAETLRVAEATLRDVDVYVFDAPPIPGFPKGLLGLGAFRGARIQLDCGRGRLHIRRRDGAG
jgi:predicted aspartyl protease